MPGKRRLFPYGAEGVAVFLRGSNAFGSASAGRGLVGAGGKEHVIWLHGFMFCGIVILGREVSGNGTGTHSDRRSGTYLKGNRV